MNNIMFNINGRSKEDLKRIINLALSLDRVGGSKPKSWLFDKEKGLIISWYWKDYSDPNNKLINFFSPPDADSLTQMIFDWLSSKEAQEVKLEKWENDEKHDGYNEKGFRVYLENWGHVGQYTNALFAVKPIYLWCGK